MNLSEKISLILVDKGFSLSPKKNTEDLINSGTEFHKSNEDIKIAEHGADKAVCVASSIDATPLFTPAFIFSGR